LVINLAEHTTILLSAIEPVQLKLREWIAAPIDLLPAQTILQILYALTTLALTILLLPSRAAPSNCNGLLTHSVEHSLQFSDCLERRCPLLFRSTKALSGIAHIRKSASNPGKPGFGALNFGILGAAATSEFCLSSLQLLPYLQQLIAVSA
jgi:hypothetical protein